MSQGIQRIFEDCSSVAFPSVSCCLDTTGTKAEVAEAAEAADGTTQQRAEKTTGSEAPSAAAVDEGIVYDSYDPLMLQQNAGREFLSFPTYNAALDEFYVKVTAPPHRV